MAVQGKGAVRTWLDWLSPEQGARDAIHPSVLFRVSRSRKYPILSSPSISPYSEGAPLPLDADTIGRSMDDLDEVQGRMNEAWESSSPQVRQGFRRYFTPPHDDGETLTEDPLATINDHVERMQKCEFPFDSSAKVQIDFLQHVQLLLSICRMVRLRLEELKGSVSLENDVELPDCNSDLEDNFSMSSSLDGALNRLRTVGSERRQSVDGVTETNNLRVPRSFPLHEEHSSNSSHEDILGIYESIEAGEFLDGVGMFGSERRQSVDIKSAEQLLDLLLEEDKHNVCNLEARYYFERFLHPSGEGDAFTATPSAAKHQIPYNGKPFRTGALAQAAAQIFREYEGN
ncbi:hypothetical protein, conserved, partial [Eimeria maxima]